VVAALFVLSFAISYAALYDYALQLEFERDFAIVFPLVLDAVISVLAVAVLKERALGRRAVTVMGRRVTAGSVRRWVHVDVAGGGYRPRTVAVHLRLMAHVSRWLEAGGCPRRI